MINIIIIFYTSSEVGMACICALESRPYTRWPWMAWNWNNKKGHPARAHLLLYGIIWEATRRPYGIHGHFLCSRDKHSRRAGLVVSYLHSPHWQKFYQTQYYRSRINISRLATATHYYIIIWFGLGKFFNKHKTFNNIHRAVLITQTASFGL